MSIIITPKSRTIANVRAINNALSALTNDNIIYELDDIHFVFSVPDNAIAQSSGIMQTLQKIAVVTTA